MGTRGICFLWAVLAAPAAELPAFPGAEGFGAKSIGGRHGQIIKVTNLNPSGPGSLQAACETPGPRIVVFEVSGVIRGEINITHPRITIAGQTAPGAGITIEGMLKNPYRIQPNLHDVTIRHVRVRPRPNRGARDASHDGIQLTDIDRLILDHVSVAWSSDENIDVCNSRELTIQWCAIEESDTEGHEKGQHNFGLIMGYRGHSATVHHNLFAHHLRRAPLVGLEVLDHRNNVIYNMRTGIDWHPPRMNEQRPGNGFRANIAGNYFKAGPNAPKTGDDLRYGMIAAKTVEEIYAEGNYFSWLGGVLDPWQIALNRGIFLQYPVRAKEPWQAPPVAMQSAQQAYELVLERAGCFPRDAVSRRTIDEVRSGTGSWGRHEPAGGLMEGLTPGKAAVDSDGDGMPDSWERKHKLNPDDPSDANGIVPQGRHKGYTYVEYYINELADQLTMARAGTRRSN
jgi:pectate lyase